MVQMNSRGDVTLVGTVHVSRDTRERVISEIQQTQPDVVSIELDAERLDRLFYKAADKSIGGTEDEGGIVKTILRRQQQSVGEADDEGTLPSGEADMLPAVETATGVGSEVALIDLPQNELFEDIQSDFVDEEGSLDLGIFDEDITEVMDAVRTIVSMQKDLRSDGESVSDVVSEMEEIDYEQLNSMMDAYGTLLPEVVDNLINKRDAYMAGKLQWIRENGDDIVAIMGRGHIPGVRELLENPETIPDEFVEEPDFYEYNTVEISA